MTEIVIAIQMRREKQSLVENRRTDVKDCFVTSFLAMTNEKIMIINLNEISLNNKGKVNGKVND
jgi:hypothetical protein